MGKEDTLKVFRELLNDFKTPYLLKLEEEPLIATSNIQDMDQVEQMLKELDLLHRILKRRLLSPDTKSTEDIHTKAVLSVFEKAGIFSAVQKDPDVKEDLIYALDLELKTYPFTRSLRHVDTLERNNVESYQRKIVSNEE